MSSSGSARDVADGSGGGPASGATSTGRRDVCLDGLRGVAILLVMLYHATLFAEAKGTGAQLLVALPRYGWSGVDLFFVLSGFLITRILWRQRGARNYFRIFYLRRVLRIFPVYYAVLAISFWVVPRTGLFEAENDFWLRGASGETLWYWLYLSNVQTALTGQFHHRFLDITWSLAIEEHFYLVWPLLVWWLARGHLVRICVGAIAGAFALRCGFLWAEASPLAVYVLTPLRIDAIAFGALVALVHERDGDWSRLDGIARRVLPAAGAVCLGVLALWSVAPGFLAPRPNLTLLAHPLTQTVGYSALAAFYAALLVRLLASGADSSLVRAFEWRPLLVLGKYSYALYLLHDQAIVFTLRALFQPKDHAWPWALEQLLFYALVFAISLAAAKLSWTLIEGPAHRLGHRYRYSR